MSISGLSRLDRETTGRGPRRYLAFTAAVVLSVSFLVIGQAGAASAGPAASGSAASTVVMAAFKNVILRYDATVSDSDHCQFSNGPASEVCADAASWDGGDEDLVSTFSGVVSATVPIKTANLLRAGGAGTGTANEFNVHLSASDTFSGAQDGAGGCADVTGTSSEAYVNSSAGSLIVDSLSAVPGSKDPIGDFHLALTQLEGVGPTENTTVTSDVTSAEGTGCLGTTTDPAGEIFGSYDIDAVHYSLGLVNPSTNLVDVSHWQVNQKWLMSDSGQLAIKDVKGSAKWVAPDSGPINLTETLEIYAGGIAGCQLTIGTPALSHRNASVTGTIHCGRDVTGLKLDVSLYRNGAVASSKSFTAHDSKSLQGSAAASCAGKVRSYRAVVQASISFPAGFLPRADEGVAKSVTVKLKC